MFNPDKPTLKARIASRECMAVSWLALGSPALVEAAARAAPDAIVIDMQHGLWERRDLEAAIGIVPAHIPVIVRVAENTALAISAALDAGAEGVMVPMIESAEEGRQAIRRAKYPPHGIRSAGGVRPLQDFAGYLRGASQIAVMLMIETTQGLANAESIARLEGLDMIFIGTGDLALSLHIQPGDTARHAAACERIRHTCQAASIACGSFTTSIEAARERREQGYHMVVAVNDIDLMAQGFAQASAQLREQK
jgi:2-keto-3-deoxy-L-rhamnonate aldolase RhmA